MEIKVAVFEDNKTLRESLQQLINSAEGLACTGTFMDANKLVRNVEMSNPDVILMDIDMPGISGIDAVRIIKSKFPSINVIMQTVFDENDKIFAAICAGASGYLLKSCPPKKIPEAIVEVFQGGSPMSSSVASKVLEMFRQQKPSESKTEFIDLSSREREILGLLVKSKSYKSIAAECFISVDTVSTHVRHIYEKLQVHSKSEAVVKAINQKLI